MKKNTQPKWFIIDAKGKVLGRLCSEIVRILHGKRIDFTPNEDTGDGVIVINAAEVAVTGRKRKNKVYSKHTGYIGGLKQVTFEKMLEKDPTYPIVHAVKGMMPKSKMGKKQLKRLRVFAGATHNLEAQQPQEI